MTATAGVGQAHRPRGGALLKVILRSCVWHRLLLIPVGSGHVYYWVAPLAGAVRFTRPCSSTSGEASNLAWNFASSSSPLGMVAPGVADIIAESVVGCGTGIAAGTGSGSGAGAGSGSGVGMAAIMLLKVSSTAGTPASAASTSSRDPAGRRPG